MKRMLNDLYDYVPLKIYQNEDYFKFSLDSVLLAEYVKNPQSKKSILELCAGNAAVSMILSTKSSANITAVEVQDEIYDLACKSVEYNSLGNKIKVVKSDVKDDENYFPGNNFDVIVCNPPYFSKCSTSEVNKDKIKAIARHELLIDLESIIKISSKILDKNGELYLVHRVERLDEIIVLCNKYDINVKNIQLISTKSDGNPKLCLVRAVKGSKFNVKVSKTICIENLKSFKNIFWKE